METDLLALVLKAVQDGLIGGSGETALETSLLVPLEALAHTLRTIIESVAERLVDAGEFVSLGHEHLWAAVSGRSEITFFRERARNRFPGLRHSPVRMRSSMLEDELPRIWVADPCLRALLL
jgi:hypothetical protein